MYRNANIIVEIGCMIALRHFYIAPRYQDFTYICNWLTMYVYPPFSTNFGGLYLTQFLTDFCQILDSKSYDQA